MLLTGEIRTVHEYLDQKLPQYLEMLRQMVEINSYTANAAGVNELASVTSEMFAELGFSAESIPCGVTEYGDHLVLTRTGTGPHKIGLVSHLDTVFPSEEEIANDFHWRVEGERIYGPGTVDIKGGTVAIYMLMDAMQRFAPVAYESITWVVLLDSAEERGGGGNFGQVCLDRLRDGGLANLVFEAGAYEGDFYPILVKRKGSASYRVTVEGRSSHAGTSHTEGANAIVQMADVIQQIASFTDYERELTFNVGRVEGGVVTNRVPHEAVAYLEMRCYESDVFEDGVAKMMALNHYSTVRAVSDQFPCKVTVELLGQMAPWSRNEGSENAFAHWSAAAEELEVTAVQTWRGGLSDGNMTWREVPTLDALGPAGGNGHCSERSADGSKDQEYMIPASLVPKTLLNYRAVLNLIAASASANSQ
ncbi:MAG: M20/M25/M40 family metallo-hydrolase [Candidatus Promineifilaceae bacterium]